MQQDYHYPAAEKILSDIEIIIRRDQKLNTLEILPVTRNENKSPIHYIEHCLGLERWCIPHVYCHSYNYIMSVRRLKSSREDPGRVCRLLMGVLMINPEVSSFWNMRKEFISRSKIDIDFELNLTALILSRKPKCDDVFNHRKWIIKRMLKDFQSDISLLTKELEVCEMAAERYANNYHAWSHRIWCLNQIGSTNRDKIYQIEWAWSEKWISAHVSDYSGLHYRTFLINSIINWSASYEIGPCLDHSFDQFVQIVSSVGGVLHDEPPLPLKVFIYELILSTELIETFHGHEALWCHRRSVFQLLKSLLSKSKSKPIIHQNTEGIPVRKDFKMDSNMIDDSFIKLINLYEKLFLDNVHKYNDTRQIGYSEKHVEWIGKILKIECHIDR